ncbi:hypothetical protein FQA47_021638 [Oryzias melastigma]|uniref:Uncharacterized protein n=1 Tax=Oryzias melastigma TaxID=30732 RepID=A0A834BYV6_ORYME|nr:hypothetical protein FQA47_021638 [Oryzias melastigma]
MSHCCKNKEVFELQQNLSAARLTKRRGIASLEETCGLCAVLSCRGRIFHSFELNTNFTTSGALQRTQMCKSAFILKSVKQTFPPQLLTDQNVTSGRRRSCVL